ncbi:alpha/beta fold hydrolase [Pyruvatibacter sp.]|uniref:alpha/beta fold hydrolase n=1 Tax=Pyruvatibacter sp. TaxID=1981328 RepID=UPI0032ED7343
MIWSLLVVMAVGLLGVSAYVMLDLWLKPLDEAARAKAPGAFISARAGLLHYTWDGPADGPVVVMVHGFSTPHFIFEQNVAALTDQGYRVLRFDHFGRGWSDRPIARYDADFYDEALLNLLDGLSLTGPVGLVGLSMGGPIVAEFAARHPQRVNRVLLFVPAGLDVAGLTGFAARLLNVPGLGDLMWRAIGRSVLLNDPQYNERGEPPENRLAGNVSTQMEYRGYLDALLATMRNMPMSNRAETYRRLAQTGIPVAAIFGKDDPTVLPASVDKLAAYIPEAQIHLLENADHGLNYKRHRAANPLLAAFFDPHS